MTGNPEPATLDRKPMSNTEYVLSEIRVARSHASLWLNHLDTIGVALRGNLITPETAVAQLRECQFFQPIVDTPVIAEVDAEGSK